MLGKTIEEYENELNIYYGASTMANLINSLTAELASHMGAGF